MTGLPTFDISGQVAFVTGASSGIGEHFAEILVVFGFRKPAARFNRLPVVYITESNDISIRACCETT